MKQLCGLQEALGPCGRHSFMQCRCFLAPNAGTSMLFQRRREWTVEKRVLKCELGATLEASKPHHTLGLLNVLF